MIIGIDASRAFLDKKTGTEMYSYQIIKHLIQLPEAKSHTWILYVRPSKNLKLEIRNLKLNSNWKLKIVNLPLLWTQLGLAALTWVDRLDCLWVPAHTLPILRRPGIRTVVTIHGLEYEFLPEYKNGLQKWYLPLSTWYAVKWADKIIAVSAFTKQQLVDRLAAVPKKITVIWEGVDRTGSHLVRQRSHKVRPFGLRAKQYLLFVGTVQPRKNLKRLIMAFNLMSQKLTKNIKLVIAGKFGWDYEDVLEAIKHNPQNIVLTGYLDEADKYTLLQNALVYVQPSITEGFGLPVIEAMLAGVPLVSSKGGALAEVVGDAGLLFDPYNIQEINHALSLVVDSHSLREELIMKGKKRAKIFSWEKAAFETYKLLI